jgi:hypothetical protein
MFLIGPFTYNTAISLAVGILATSNIKVADICIKLLYTFWSIYTCILATSIAYCGSRLAQALNAHSRKFNPNSERYLKIKTGVFKVTLFKIEALVYKEKNVFDFLLLTFILDLVDGSNFIYNILFFYHFFSTVSIFTRSYHEILCGEHSPLHYLEFNSRNWNSFYRTNYCFQVKHSIDQR